MHYTLFVYNSIHCPRNSLCIPSQIHTNNIFKCLWKIILTKSIISCIWTLEVHIDRTGTTVLVIHWFKVHHLCIYDHATCTFYVKMGNRVRTSHSAFPNKGQCIYVPSLSYDFRWYAPIYIFKRWINPNGQSGIDNPQMRSCKLGIILKMKTNKKNYIIQKIKAN